MSICENTVQVDDFEPSIVYSGPWQAFHDKTYGINGTGHVATRTGLSANFKFNGSCLIVKGIVGVGGTRPMPPTTFILDGNFEQINTSATIGEPFSLASQYASAVLYAASTMTEGPHELIITNLDGNDKTPLVLDAFFYTPLEPQRESFNTTASSSTIITTSVSHWQPSPADTSSSIPSHSVSPISSSSSPPHSKTLAIVGGVIGAICFLLLVIFGYVAWRRLSRRHRNEDHVVSDVRPFASWHVDDLPVQTHTYIQTQIQVRAPDTSPVIAAGGNMSPSGPEPAAASTRRKQTFTLQPNVSAGSVSSPAHRHAPPPEAGSSALQQAPTPVHYEHVQAAGSPSPPSPPSPRRNWLPQIEDCYDLSVQPPKYTP